MFFVTAPRPDLQRLREESEARTANLRQTEGFQPPKLRILIGIGLEFAALAPMFVGSSFRAAFLEPNEVGALAKVVVESVTPVFLRSPRETAVLLPKKIGAFAKVILQTLSCTFQGVSIIPVRSQRPTPSNMHLRGEGLDIFTGYKLRVSG